MIAVSQNICHALLTRFNTRQKPQVDARVISNEWLSARMKLFREITVPSVANQTRQPDIWLVFFDVETPAETRNAFAQLAARLPALRAHFCATLDLEICRTVVREAFPQNADWLLTTRLDNDDALHPDFIQTVTSCVEVGRREFINPTNGLIVASGKLYRKRDVSSPFISLSEPMSECKTVWLDQHQRLSRHGQIRQVALRDAWIQVVHGGNIANQVRGVRVLPSSVPADTLPPALAAGILNPSIGEFVFDNTAGLIRRYAGSVSRRAARVWKDRKTK